MRFLNVSRSIRALHEASTQPPVVMAGRLGRQRARRRGDTGRSSRRACRRRGQSVGGSINGAHASGIAAYAGKYGVNPPIQREPVSGLLAASLRLRPETHEAGYRMKRAIDVTGRSVDPSMVSANVEMVKVLLPRKAGS
jgi:hypothetical protein